jgi:hypothetical protein
MAQPDVQGCCLSILSSFCSLCRSGTTLLQFFWEKLWLRTI